MHLPGVSGTGLSRLNIYRRKLKHARIRLPTISMPGLLNMFRDGLLGQDVEARVIDSVLSKPTIRMMIVETGGVPGLLDQLTIIVARNITAGHKFGRCVLLLR